jgi:hypothetical protein
MESDMQELKQKEGHSKRIGGHRDAGKEKHWRGLVQKFNVSGLSVSRFCAAEKLNESNFYSWRKVIRQRDNEQVSEVLDHKPEIRNRLFVPVRMQDVKSQVLEIELPGGALVKVTGQTNLALLAAVLRFLGRE